MFIAVKKSLIAVEEIIGVSIQLARLKNIICSQLL